jgi:two-component system LytT family sensor kinase
MKLNQLTYMGGMEPLSAANLVGQSYGFAIGTILSTMLVVLVARSGGSDRVPRFLFALCILVANCSGLVKNVVLSFSDFPSADQVARIRSVGFIAAAMLPLSITIIWRNNAISELRRKIGNWVVSYAAASGLAIATGLALGAWAPAYASGVPIFHPLLLQDLVGNLTFYNGLVLIVLGGIFLLPGTLDNLTDRVAVFLMIAGIGLSSLSAILDAHASLPMTLAHIVRVTRFQSIGLLVIGTLVYFSHFRAADIFAKNAIRLLLGAALSMLTTLAVFGPGASIARRTGSRTVFSLLFETAVTGGAIVLYMRLGSLTDVLVERGIYGKRDARLAIQEFRDRLGLLETRESILSAMKDIAVETLGMKSDEISALSAAQLTENAKMLVLPIPFRGDKMQLVVSLEGNRRTMLSAEVHSLQEIAFHTGRRLDELDREEERFERIRLESRLSEQLVQSELRALRAQINPHFLFNSLNTIVALIDPEPAKAETITVRLASIFRYVLLHADRPLTSLDEEIRFLRTYLDIEQIRFGERLQVQFDVDEAISFIAIPSLILQPLVENAIKHGIAPKIGVSRILVQAKREGKSIFLSVEDDGVGLFVNGNAGESSPPGGDSNTGIGLQNIRERLKTMYGPGASLSLINLQGGGSRATLEIPIGV